MDLMRTRDSLAAVQWWDCHLSTDIDSMQWKSSGFFFFQFAYCDHRFDEEMDSMKMLYASFIFWVRVFWLILHDRFLGHSVGLLALKNIIYYC